ncbi:MAG: leucine--tRNA ligase [Candidatus Woesearchaeota archaeon]
MHIEKKWQKKWKEQQVFVPHITDKQKFFITVPYPYANSALHIGHGRTFTAADILARYQRLLGKNVLYPMAFHVSGTPVLAVADAIAQGDQKQIGLTRDAIAQYQKDTAEQNRLLASFSDPQAIANFFSGTIEQTFDSVGLSIDWTKQFNTGDVHYQKYVQWKFLELKRLGILTQGAYPILYSPADQNAVGEDDIKDADTHKVSISEMKYIKFKLTTQDAYIVAATLRPDSLFGATNIFIKPDMDLSLIQVGNEQWIVSCASVVKIQHQFEDVHEISTHKGSEFIGKHVMVPLLDKEVPVYPMEYPDEHHGTGIVYSSPADSPHDYIHLFCLQYPHTSLATFDTDPLGLTPITQTKDKKGNIIKYISDIPAFDILKKRGIYTIKGNEQALEQAKEDLYKEAHYGAVMINCGVFDGTPLKGNVGAQKVTDALQQIGAGGIFYETSRRAVTRNNGQVIVANMQGQWFLDYSSEQTKQKVYEMLDGMAFFPENLKHTQHAYLAWVQKRPCARKRGIGTPLIDDEQWIVEPLSDSTTYQMLYPIADMLYKQDAQCLIPELFSFLFQDRGSLEQVSALSGIAFQDIRAMKDRLEYWQSFDVRYTNTPHMSNHLSFLLYHYALLFPKKYHPKNITIGGLLIKDGHKISKSKGNGIPLIRVPELYSADLYRLYVALGANYDAEMDFRDEEIMQLQRKFEKWKLYMQQANMSYTPKADTQTIDTWLINRFYSYVKQYFILMDTMKIREAYIGVFYEFLNDMTYFERRCGSEALYNVLAQVADDYCLLMTPLVPHICEELHELRGNTGFISVKAYTTIYEPTQDHGEDMIRTLLATIARDNKNARKIIIGQATDVRFEVFDRLRVLLEKTRDFKEIMQALSDIDDKKFITKFVPKTLGQGLHAYMDKQVERAYLQQACEFMSKETQCEVVLGQDNAGALPGKPGVTYE